MSKEALFNVLNHHFDFSGLKVLDLFAGTGNISYEFASRGCNDLTCVDADFGCVKFIKQTAAEFDFNITAVKSDVFKFIEKCGVTYDLIFADPPYDLSQEVFEQLVKDIFKYQLLSEEGMLIIEHSKHTALNHLLHYAQGRNYGGSVFSFFEISSE